jgi:SAM-dependent methyltransferase
MTTPTLSFDELAANIRAQAQTMQDQAAVHQPVSDDDWRSLSFSLPQFDVAQWAARPVLNEMSGPQAVDHAYRVILGRAPDAEGLVSGEQSLALGMPPLLFAGVLLTSVEGRQRPRPEPGFELYAVLAGLYKLAVRVRRLVRLPVVRPVVWLARTAAAFHRRWDANNLARWQVQSLRTTLATWQPVLERQAGQLGAAQQAVCLLQDELAGLRNDLSVARARLNALGLAMQPDKQEQQGQCDQPDQQDQQRSAPLTPLGESESAAPVPSGPPQKSDSKVGVEPASPLDAYYLAFEDAHRASARDLRRGFQVYQPLLESLKASQSNHANPSNTNTPLASLDLGCGRGEWLSFLQEQGFKALGIDASPAMVGHCQAQGLKVQQADLIQALRSQPNASLYLLTAFHVAEHLRFDMLYGLVAEAWRVLKPHGVLLLETPNPENPLVGSHTFYHDPTHRNPLTPTAMQFLLQYHGFEQVNVLRLNPYPESARLPGEDLLTERMNGLLCGPQDFAVVGRRSAQSA